MTEMAPLARVNVGGVTAENPLWLAPLAEISMPPVRALFRRMGVGLTHTEMVSSSGLCHGNRATLGMLPREGERPIVLQLFGDEAEEMGRSLEIALFRGVTPQAVQINMACPVRKVFRRGEGARLLERPEVAEAMIRTLVPFGLPVWAKIRLAGRGCPLSTEAFCEVLFAAGASCVALHGRTAAQMYEGTGDRDAVGALARAFPGSIVGSGTCTPPKTSGTIWPGGARRCSWPGGECGTSTACRGSSEIWATPWRRSSSIPPPPSGWKPFWLWRTTWRKKRENEGP